MKYGVTRDYVRGLTVVLPTGEIVELGGKIVKNSSGYSLKDLIVGSEGTLGVITQAVLKLLPLPSHSVSLLVPFDSMEAALEVVPCIVRAKVSPTAIEYMSRETILFSESYLGKKFPDTHASAYILLTFDGNAAAQVDGELEAVAELCLEHGAQDAYIVDTDERKKSVWDARGAFLEAHQGLHPPKWMNAMWWCPAARLRSSSVIPIRSRKALAFASRALVMRVTEICTSIFAETAWRKRNSSVGCSRPLR